MSLFGMFLGMGLLIGGWVIIGRAWKSSLQRRALDRIGASFNSTSTPPPGVVSNILGSRGASGFLRTPRR